MQALYIGLALLLGVLIPFQSLINARMTAYLGHSLAASLISMAGGFFIFLILCLVFPIPFPTMSKLQNAPLHLYLGGLIGAIFVITAIFVFPKIGATAFTALLVAGQLIMTLVIDHYGMMGLASSPINLMRLVGTGFLFLGCFLILKF